MHYPVCKHKVLNLNHLFLDRHVEKESLADYIGKKREMFLVQVSLIWENYNHN